MPLGKYVVKALERAPYIVTRHPAARRQMLLERAGVDLVLDVGAAGGAYGRSLRAFGYQRRIESFEPMSEPFGRLISASAADPHWRAHPIALGDEDGTAKINVAGDASSLLPMLDAHRRAAPDIAVAGQEEIEVRRLDGLADEVVRTAAAPFLKIDTQGFERQVLRGAEATIPSLVGLQLELSLVELYEGSMLIAEAVAWAYDHGLVLAGVERGFIAPTGQALQVDGVFFRPDVLR